MFELLNDLDTEIRRYNSDTMRPRVRRHSTLLCCARSPYAQYASLPRLAAHSACALWTLRPAAQWERWIFGMGDGGI